MRNIVFEAHAFEQFNAWAVEERKIYAKIVKLIDDIQRHPFEGLGKPEPLKHHLTECWARRITEEHRLVYQVNDTEIIVLSCKFHYR